MEQVEVKSIDELGIAAKSILRMIGNNRIICFYGSMGAGKTTLIKAICDVIGVKDNVASPTFALVNEYKDRNANAVYHFDFYRINKLKTFSRLRRG